MASPDKSIVYVLILKNRDKSFLLFLYQIKQVARFLQMLLDKLKALAYTHVF
jgi:hypothetical protein